MTTYTTDGAFSSTGLEVSASYSDNTTAPVTDYTLSWNNAALAEGSTAITAEAGSKTVTVSWQGRTATFTITVTTAALTGISVTSPPAVTAYTAGGAFSSAGLEVSASYSDNTTAPVTDYTLSWNNTALAEGS
ncbi:MAG: bacterial Ig-like domain-containing protein, partial [Treponema sp.]|nr:bacterial Ig-like domain-containing protein [Treponema sp.]